jgi:hypothetical protein
MSAWWLPAAFLVAALIAGIVDYGGVIARIH